MPTEDQIVQIPFGEGIDELYADKVLEPPALKRAVNVMCSRKGQTCKRHGFSSESVAKWEGGNLSGITRLVPIADTWGAVADRDLYAHTTGQDKSRLIGAVPSAVVTRNAITALPFDPVNTGITGVGALTCDSVELNGYIVVAYIAKHPTVAGLCLYAQVQEASTGILVRAPEIIGIPQLLDRPSLAIAAISASNHVMVFCQVAGGGNNISASRIQLSSSTTINAGWTTAFPALPAPAGVLPVSHNCFDATSGSGFCWLVYHDTGLNLSVLALTAAFGGATATILNPTAAGACIGGDESDVVWVAYADSFLGETRITGLDPATLVTVYGFNAPATIPAVLRLKMGVLGVGGGSGILVASTGEFVAESTMATWIVNFGNAAGVVSVVNTRKCFDTVAITKPFAYAGNQYCGMSFQKDDYAQFGVPDPGRRSLAIVSILQATNTLTLSPKAFVACRLLWPLLYPYIDVVFTAGENQCRPLTVSMTSLGHPTFGLPTSKTNETLSFDRVVWEQASRDANGYAEIDRTTFLSGSALYATDGATTFDVNFLGPPMVAVAGIVGALPAGTYQYRAIYRWIDANGNVHRSQPSLAAKVVLAVPAAMSVTISTLGITQHGAASTTGPNRVWIDLYRTKRLEDGDLTFYLHSSKLNDTTTAIVTVVDGTGDAELKNPPLYTSGDILDNQCPPGLRFPKQFKNRLAGVGDDGRTVYLSQLRNPGDGLAFNDALTINFPDGGDITALAVMDDRLVIFKRDRIYWISGEGPNAQGLNSDWGLPVQVPSDCGCISAGSIVVVPKGVVFQSAQGLMLLTRGLVVEYIGGNAAETLASYPVIRDATTFLTGGDNFALFACENTGGTDGRVILWDYRFDFWAVWAPYTGAGYWVKGWLAQADGLRANLSSGGLVSKLDTVNSLDSGAWVTYDVETANFKPGLMKGLQSFAWLKRMCVIGSSVSAHVLRVRIASDFSDSYYSDRTWAEGVSGVTSPATVEQAMVHCAKKGSAFRVRITDSAPAVVGTGKGPTLEGLALLVGLKKGLPKLSEARRK